MLMHTLESLPRVLLAGLIFGAGMPTIFAIALWAQTGETETRPDGSIHEVAAPSVLRRIIAGILYCAIAVMIIVGVLWISQHFLYVTFDLDIFGTEGRG